MVDTWLAIGRQLAAPTASLMLIWVCRRPPWGRGDDGLAASPRVRKLHYWLGRSASKLRVAEGCAVGCVIVDPPCSRDGRQDTEYAYFVYTVQKYN
jgi:hypothetical protein